jgi:hypothetical protein
MTRAAILQQPTMQPHALDEWLLTSPLIYRSDLPEALAAFPDGVISVPAGYICDLASVPRVPGIYFRYGGRARLASVLHDWMYDCRRDVPRSVADRIFLEAMTVTDDPPAASARWVMWAAVRLVGWRYWRVQPVRRCPEWKP